MIGVFGGSVGGAIQHVKTGVVVGLACLFFQLFLMSFHDRFDYSAWLEKGEDYKGPLTSRTLTTIYGEVRYWRTYLIRKEGGGFYPVDAGIGLTGDGLSPLVMR